MIVPAETAVVLRFLVILFLFSQTFVLLIDRRNTTLFIMNQKGPIVILPIFLFRTPMMYAVQVSSVQLLPAARQLCSIYYHLPWDAVDWLIPPTIRLGSNHSALQFC